ncbi:unnamed protein product [Discula destructiva]
MKTVLRRSDAAKPPKHPSTQPTGHTHSSISATLDTGVPTASTVVDTSRTSPVTPETNALPEVDEAVAAIDGIEEAPPFQVYNDRSHDSHKISGLDVDPNHFSQTEGHMLRVSKTPRMRIHRQCHQCGNELNKYGVWQKCSHNFCNQCTRHPPKRTEAEKTATRETKAEILKERSANPTIWPDSTFDAQAPVVVVRPAKPEQQLVYKKVRQRVRRKCCQCMEADGSEVIFLSGGRDCPKCSHVRCTDCPRDPPKRDKYPYGYPGDAFGANSIPHFRCHECYSKFPPGVENGTVCAQCSHEKCDHCARLKPQKVEPGSDIELPKSVQEQKAAMSTS